MLDKRIRRIYFWVLFGLFFLTVAPIIFYAMGYRFSFDRGVFVFTGSISIDSNPRTIDVMIDGVKNTSKKISRLNNSYHIGGIKPGEHLIEITSPDFQSWSKKISVNSGTSTEFWNILLLRNNYERTGYNIPNIKKFFLRPDDKLAACVVEENGKTIVKVLNFNNLKVEDVFSTDEYHFFYGDENIEWSKQDSKMIIPLTKDGQRKYFVVDTETKEAVNLNEIAGAENISHVRWDSQNKDYFYYISENNLFRITTAGEQKNQIASQISSYDLSGSNVYYFQLPAGLVYKTDPDGFSEPVQMIKSAPSDMGDSNYKLTVYDQDRIAMLNSNGKLYIYNNGIQKQYFRKLADNVKDVQFSDDGKKLLYFSNWEIFVYFTRDWEVQPWRSENEQQDIIRFSKEIANVQWSKDYEHVIYSVDNKLKIAEIDNRSKRNFGDITNFNDYKNWSISDAYNDNIFFIDNNELYSIEFPEKTGFMGIGGN